jgi:hypothetical protein
MRSSDDEGRSIRSDALYPALSGEWEVPVTRNAKITPVNGHPADPTHITEAIKRSDEYLEAPEHVVADGERDEMLENIAILALWTEKPSFHPPTAADGQRGRVRIDCEPSQALSGLA